MQPDFEIWLDHQLPAVVAKRIRDELGFTAKSSFTLQSQIWSDWKIFTAARNHSVPVILLSKDADFPQLIEQHGVPPKLIRIATGNLITRLLWQQLRDLLPTAVELLLTTDTEIITIEKQSLNK